MSAPLPVAVIERAEDAATALQPLRLDLLRRLATPESASSLARQVGIGRQKLNYHLKALLKAGLIEQVEERRKGNCVEQMLQARAHAYVVSPNALAQVRVDASRVQDRFSWGYLIAVCARSINDLWTLRGKADANKQQLATLALEATIKFRSPGERSAFANEFATTLATLARKYHAPDAEEGRAFRVFAGVHPELSEPNPEAPNPEAPNPEAPNPEAPNTEDLED